MKYTLYVTSRTPRRGSVRFVRHFDSIFDLLDYLEAFGRSIESWHIVQHDKSLTTKEISHLITHTYDPKQLELPF